MIDFISVRITECDFEKIYNNPAVTYRQSQGDHSGVVFSQSISYKGMFLKDTEHEDGRRKTIMRNSIHKLQHGQNGTDYTIEDFRRSLEDLQANLGVNPACCELRSFEFGVNIRTDVCPDEIIERLVQYKTKPFEKMPHIKGRYKCIGRQADLDQYTLKIYNKGKQYGLQEQLMRIEIKVRKMKFVNSKGYQIKTLADLAERSAWCHLSKILMDAYRHIVLVEKVNEDALTGREMDLYMSGMDMSFWERWRKKNRNTCKSKLKRFKEIIADHRNTNFKDDIRNAIENKLRELFGGCEDDSSPIFTTLQAKDRQTEIHPNSLLVYKVNPDDMNDEQRDRFNRRVCIVCCTDLSHRRKDCKTCGKDCRNALSNPRHSIIRRLMRIVDTGAQGVLFPIWECVDVSRLWREYQVRISAQ